MTERKARIRIDPIDNSRPCRGSKSHDFTELAYGSTCRSLGLRLSEAKVLPGKVIRKAVQSKIESARCHDTRRTVTSCYRPPKSALK